MRLYLVLTPTGEHADAKHGGLGIIFILFIACESAKW